MARETSGMAVTSTKVGGSAEVGVKRRGSIAGDQDVVNGNAENQGAVAAYSFKHPYADAAAAQNANLTSPNAPDPTAAEVFHHNPNESRGLTRAKISGFLNHYGPIGMNTLSNSEMSLLLSMGMAVAAGTVATGGDANQIMNFMKTHASNVASRSAIDQTTNGNGVPNASGGETDGFGYTHQYGTGDSSGEPAGSSPLGHPPTVTALVQASFVDNEFKGTGIANVETDPGGHQADQTKNGPNDGESTVSDFKGTGIVNPEKMPDDGANALATSEGGDATVQVDTRGLRERFRASAAYRNAFASWSTSQDARVA